ncbi:MAG: vWA domain-containing protein [Fibrobacteria bacterium]
MSSRFSSLCSFILPLCLSLGAMSVDAAAAAAKRCDWHGPLSGGEKPYAKCVDFAALNGKTLDLPKNVTRISADGLSFCQTATPTTGAGDADIVFVYDNSGSMTADGAYIDPVAKDTSFYYLEGNRDDPCLDNIAKPAATMTYPSREGGNWTVLALKGEAGCSGNVAGDPYNARGAVIRSGIDFLASTSPTSTAGAVSFNSEIKYLQPPVLLGNAANVNLVKNSVHLDTSGGTLYRPPLEKAKQWLTTSSLIKTGKQAIIFISDGAPKDNDYLGLVDANMPPIFSIYLSKSVTQDTARLKELSDRTGGTFTRVNSNDPAAIDALLKSIITTITKNTLPRSAVVTNSSLSPVQSSKSTGVVVNPDGSAGMPLDSIIALKTGPNQIKITLTAEDGSATSYAFTMNVAGGEIGSSSGNYTCWDMPTLTALDPANAVPEIYDLAGSAYRLKLTRSPSELHDVTVEASSFNKDEESIKISKLDNALGYPVQIGDFKYDPDQSDVDPGNGILEVDGKGDLTFTWSHPRDARETVTYLLPGRIIPVLDGEVKLTIKEPVTHGESFDPDKLKDKDKVVVTDAKDHCILNCSGTDEFHSGTAAPTWEISVKSPIRYDVRVYDNLGQFVSRSEGEMTETDWAKLAKTGDSAALHIKLVPVSHDGQQLGTGAYLMHADITAMGDLVTKSASGESIIVRNGKTEYLKRFGYVRR